VSILIKRSIRLSLKADQRKLLKIPVGCSMFIQKQLICFYIVRTLK